MALTTEQAIERLREAESLLALARDLIVCLEKYRPARKEMVLRELTSFEESRVCYECGEKPEKEEDINGLPHHWCYNCDKNPFK